MGGAWSYKNPHNSRFYDGKLKKHMMFENSKRKSFEQDQSEICSYSRLEMRVDRS